MLYDVNYLTRPTGNAFAGDIKGMDSKRYSGSGAAGSQADVLITFSEQDEVCYIYTTPIQ